MLITRPSSLGGKGGHVGILEVDVLGTIMYVPGKEVGRGSLWRYGTVLGSSSVFRREGMDRLNEWM